MQTDSHNHSKVKLCVETLTQYRLQRKRQTRTFNLGLAKNRDAYTKLLILLLQQVESTGQFELLSAIKNDIQVELMKPKKLSQPDGIHRYEFFETLDTVNCILAD